MIKITAALTLLLLAGCTVSPASAPSQATFHASPFVGVDLSRLPAEERRIFSEAAEDFASVQRGRSPAHAVVDTKADLPADGGTNFYVGRGYRLTIVKSLSRFGSIDGYAYGPVIRFDSSFATGNIDTVSDVRFYSDDALRALLKAGR
jgi:hypothetical protein